MAQMNWEHRSRQERTRNALISAAATDLPGAIRAAYTSTCSQCTNGIARGAHIIKHAPTGDYLHPKCYVARTTTGRRTT